MSTRENIRLIARAPLYHYSLLLRYLLIHLNNSIILKMFFLHLELII